MYKYIFFIALVFHSAFEANAQQDSIPQKKDQKEVEILNSDILKFKTFEDGTSVRKLIGNVELKQDNTLMFCDSAYLYKESNTLDAFGNVKINESDSLFAYSDFLKYNGNTKVAKLIQNARMEDEDMTLYSDTLYYNTKEKMGFYLHFGKLITDSSVLTSNIGYYFSNTKMAEFKDSVVVIDPDYRIESDTLHYHTKTKIAYFFGPTTIYSDSTIIECILGIYDTENDLAEFGENTIIYNPPQTLFADSIYYDKNAGHTQAFKHFIWVDEEQKAGMTGTTADFYEENNEIIAYNRPVLHIEMEEDTMFLSGNIVHSIERDENEFKEFWAYHTARIFKSDLQGVCDSLYYSEGDSMMRMYRNPILWNENTEMKGDTIYIQMANEQVDYIDFMDNAFIITQSVGRIFDQVKSKFMKGYFEDGKMHKMFSNRNVESLYFGKDEEIPNKVTGSNFVKSSSMWTYFLDGEIDNIVFIDNPDALFTPISKIPKSKFFLEGFYWNSNIRPKSKYDL